MFICKRKKNTTPCAYHAVPEKMLMMVAMDQIHHLVDAFVSMVYLYDDQTMKIEFNCEDVIRRALEKYGT